MTDKTTNTQPADVNKLCDLQRLLVAIVQQDGILFDLECASEFEPHGQATETWEIVWRLTIPSIPFHWKRNDGKWQKGTTDAPMAFKARTVESVVAAAIGFATAKISKVVNR